MSKNVLAETIFRFAIVNILQLGSFFLSSKLLSVSDFGILNIQLAIAFVVANLATFGLPNSIVYFGHDAKRKLWVSKILIQHSLLITLIFFIAAILSFCFFNGDYSSLIVYFASQHLFLILNGFFQSENRVRVMNVVNLAQWVMVFSILLFCAIYAMHISVDQILLLYSIGCLVPFLFFIRVSKFRTMLHDSELTSDISKAEFYLYGLQNLINSIISFLNHRLDTIVIGYFIGANGAGYYSFASQICEKMSIFSQAYSTVLFPKLVRLGNNNQKYGLATKQIYALAIMTTPLFIMFYLVNDKLITFFFGLKYISSYGVIDVLIWSVFVVSLERILFTYFSSIGCVSLNSKIGIITLMVNSVFSLVLVQHFGVYGVAFSTLLSSLVSAFLAYYFFGKINE